MTILAAKLEQVWFNKQARQETPDAWIKRCDELSSKRRKTIQLQLDSVMGGSTKGLKEFKAHRRLKPKKYSTMGATFVKEAILLLPIDAVKGSAISNIRLWKVTKTSLVQPTRDEVWDGDEYAVRSVSKRPSETWRLK